MSSMGKVDDPYLLEVAAGVFAYIQPDGSWFLNNAGFVKGSTAAVLVDQCATEDRARTLLGAVETATGLPLRALINTHHHGDHTFGNFVVPPETAVIGHHHTREAVLATGTMTTGLVEGPEWGDIVIRPPMITFDDRLTVWAGDTEMQLIHFGTPAHTTNDVVVWLPAGRVLFSGDLVFDGGTPFAVEGSIAGWLETCDLLEALEPEVVVPGHGMVTDVSAIEEVRSYLRFVEEAGRRGLEAGMSPLEAARSTDLGGFTHLTDTERLVGNLHRAYAEASGQPRGGPVDLMGVVADMVAYNGGPIRSHA